MKSSSLGVSLAYPLNQHFLVPSAQVWRVSLSVLKCLSTFESFHPSVTVRPVRPVEPVEPVGVEKGSSQWKGNSTGLNKKVCNCVTSNGLRKNGQVELRWGESTRVERSWEEKREMTRELRRVKMMCTEMQVVENSWREVKSWEVVSQFATRGQKPWKRAWKSAAAPIGKPCFWIL